VAAAAGCMAASGRVLLLRRRRMDGSRRGVGLHGQHDGSIRAGPAGSVSRGRRGGRGGPLRPDCAAPVLAPAILAASRPGGGDMGRQPAETRRPGSRDGGRGGHTNRPRYRRGRNDKLDSQGQPSLPPSAAPARPGPSLRPAYLWLWL
jgi:hypothetical protein